MTQYDDTKASPEQIRYANILSYGAWGGMFAMVITFAIYLSGALGAQVSLDQVTNNWTNPAIRVLETDGHGHIVKYEKIESVAMCAEGETCLSGVAAYQTITHSPSGWSWLNMVDKGDYLNFIPIAFLAALTIFCYLTLIPAYIKKKDTIYLGLVIAEVVVLTVAASGLLGSGGH